MNWRSKVAKKVGHSAVLLAHGAGWLSFVKPSLINEYLRSYESLETVLELIRILKDANTRVPIKPLIKALGDKDIDVQAKLAEALAQTGTAAVEPRIAALLELAKADNTKLRLWAGDALPLIGRAAVEPLVLALRNVDARTRATAAEALGKIGGAKAIKPLIGALKDDEVAVRVSAAKALEHLGIPATGPLIELLKTENDAKNRE